MGTKVSAFTAASALDGTEVAPIVQSAASRKATIEKMGCGPAAQVTSAGALTYSRGCANAAKTATGDYTVTLSRSYATNAFALAQANTGGAAVICNAEFSGTSTVRVKTYDAAGVAADAGFHLLVVVLG